MTVSKSPSLNMISQDKPQMRLPPTLALPIATMVAADALQNFTANFARHDIGSLIKIVVSYDILGYSSVMSTLAR